MSLAEELREINEEIQAIQADLSNTEDMDWRYGEAMEGRLEYLVERRSEIIEELQNMNEFMV